MTEHMGRVPDFIKDPKLLGRVISFVRSGCSYVDACGACGIPESTFYSWKKKAKKPGADPKLVEFLENLLRARSEGKAAMVATINRAGRGTPIFNDKDEVIGYRDGDWKASAHLLAIIDPESYSLRRKHEHSGPQGAPIAVDMYDAIRLPATESEPGEDDESTEPDPGEYGEDD